MIVQEYKDSEQSTVFVCLFFFNRLWVFFLFKQRLSVIYSSEQ